MTARLLHGPDDGVWLWWRLTAREETAGGRDPFLIKGNVPESTCAACGHDRYHEVPARRGGIVTRCQRCGALWKSAMEYVPRGAVQATRRPHGLERRLVNLADLEHCIGQVPHADAMVYGLYLVTDRSYEFVAGLANEWARVLPEDWPAPPGGFTYDRVRRAVRRGRRVLRAALEARSLLARQVPVLMRAGDQEVIDALEPLPMNALVPANPLAWSGLLHEIEIDPAPPADSVVTVPLTRLSRGSARELGTVYREVPLCATP